MRAKGIGSLNRKVRKPSILERAKRISAMVRQLALDNQGDHWLHAGKLHAAQEAIDAVAYPTIITAIPSESNSPKGAM